MLIAITSSNIGATPTETQGIIIKSECAYIGLFDKQKRAKKAIFYSFDVLISCMEVNINHN